MQVIDFYLNSLKHSLESKVRDGIIEEINRQKLLLAAFALEAVSTVVFLFAFIMMSVRSISYYIVSDSSHFASTMLYAGILFVLLILSGVLFYSTQKKIQKLVQDIRLRVTAVKYLNPMKTFQDIFFDEQLKMMEEINRSKTPSMPTNEYS